jgi:hypothetical protein
MTGAKLSSPVTFAAEAVALSKPGSQGRWTAQRVIYSLDELLYHYHEIHREKNVRE